MTCVVCQDEETGGKFFCHKHWFGLPMVVREKWWAETIYNKLPPSSELLALVRNYWEGKPMYAVLARRHPGSVLGPAEAWLKRDGRVLVFSTREEAEREARTTQGSTRSVNLNYEAKEYGCAHEGQAS